MPHTVDMTKFLSNSSFLPSRIFCLNTSPLSDSSADRSPSPKGASSSGASGSPIKMGYLAASTETGWPDPRILHQSHSEAGLHGSFLQHQYTQTRDPVGGPRTQALSSALYPQALFLAYNQ
ncbi:unnamed protein product [Protopolystoma xenopodis]|uniref:Uncharacterized protein n=1 Tax=Protopolystoma xenopodis TaxID=117903 RepID=A0A3S5BQK4_9PLAT|nr:unnamed protein product [Protopolystoma xenopodis]